MKTQLKNHPAEKNFLFILIRQRKSSRVMAGDGCVKAKSPTEARKIVKNIYPKPVGVREKIELKTI
jgi:hypothetical protein